MATTDNDTPSPPAAAGPPGGAKGADLGMRYGEEITEMRRDIDWKGAFFVAAGVPGIMIFGFGGVSAMAGATAPLAWFIAVMMGFFIVFTYAEMAGLHPKKSGGASVHGATAWIRYSKVIAPVNLWVNWLAWTPVLAIGSGTAAAYVLSIFYPSDASIMTWEIYLVDLGFLGEGVHLRINAVFIIAVCLLVTVWMIQHRGILATAKTQMIVCTASLTPLFIICLIPLFTGDLELSNITPFTPLVTDAAGDLVSGSWGWEGWRNFLGAVYLATWSAFAFETAVCYNREFKHPEHDIWRAVIYSGILCVAFATLAPMAFQLFWGTEFLTSAGIADGSAVGKALATMVGGGTIVLTIFIVLLILTLMTAVMTSMAGSSRTLFQGGQDGWLPKWLGHLNHKQVPTYAMWWDLFFNVFLLLMSSYMFVMAISNVAYLIYIFLTVEATWIHRIDNSKVPRPWRCPNWMMWLGAILGFVCMFILGAGANSWGDNVLWTGWIASLAVIPFFWFRHYVTDKGKFPDHMWDDLLPEGATELEPTRAGMLPYITLVGGIAVMMLGYWMFWLR